VRPRPLNTEQDSLRRAPRNYILTNGCLLTARLAARQLLQLVEAGHQAAPKVRRRSATGIQIGSVGIPELRNAACKPMILPTAAERSLTEH